MKKRTLWLTQTAVMLAMLIALQWVTRPLGQIFTGSCVNAVLALTVMLCGLWSSMIVAALSPFLAFMLGIGPQLIQIIPAIALGNLVFVLVLWVITGSKSVCFWRQGIAWFCAAVFKFVTLYLLVVQLLCRILPLAEKQITTFTTMFSWPQLITALIGGGLAVFLAPMLKKALPRR